MMGTGIMGAAREAAVEEIAEIIDPVVWKQVLDGRRAKARGFEIFGAVPDGAEQIEKARKILALLKEKGLLS